MAAGTANPLLASAPKGMEVFVRQGPPDFRAGIIFRIRGDKFDTGFEGSQNDFDKYRRPILVCKTISGKKEEAGIIFEVPFDVPLPVDFAIYKSASLPQERVAQRDRQLSVGYQRLAQASGFKADINPEEVLKHLVDNGFVISEDQMAEPFKGEGVHVMHALFMCGTPDNNRPEVFPFSKAAYEQQMADIKANKEGQIPDMRWSASKSKKPKAGAAGGEQKEQKEAEA